MRALRLATPAVWCELRRIEIADPDGWRFKTEGLGPKSLDVPITEDEFKIRARVSTIRMIGDKDYFKKENHAT